MHINKSPTIDASTHAEAQKETVIPGQYMYPGLGDPVPDGGETVLLLTIGGACVTGTWKLDSGFIGWCRKPKRSRAKEDALASLCSVKPIC